MFLDATDVTWVCSASTLLIGLGAERRPASRREWISCASVARAPVYLAQALRGRPPPVDAARCAGRRRHPGDRDPRRGRRPVARDARHPQAELANSVASEAQDAGWADVLPIAGAALWICLFDGYGGVDDPLAWHSGRGGGRYLFLGGTRLLLLVCLSRIAGPPLGRAVAAS